MTSLFPHIPTDVMWRSVPFQDAGDAYKHTDTYTDTHTNTCIQTPTHKYTLACAFIVAELSTHPVKWRSPFIQAGQMCSFRVQPPWSPNIQRGIVVWGKWVAHSKLELCVWERRDGKRGKGEVAKRYSSNNKGAQCWKWTARVVVIFITEKQALSIKM